MPKPNRGLQIKRRKDRPGIWEVGQYQQGKWKRIRTGLSSFEEAQTERYKIERAKRNGIIFELSERKIGDMIADFIEERGPSILSGQTFDIVTTNLLMFSKEDTLAHINEPWSNSYYTHRNEKWRKKQELINKKYNRNKEITDISSATIGRELRQLRAMIQRDYDMGRITQKPKVWIRPERHRKPSIPSRKEVILEARGSKVGSCRRKYILISFYTGARKGSVLSLRWYQVHAHHIDFNESGSQSNKKKAIIPLTGKLQSYMKIWRKRGTDLGPVIHRNQKPISDIKDCPISLRHAAAVQMLINKIEPYKVAKYLGNTVEMIEKHYGHLIPGHLNEAAEALG